MKTSEAFEQAYKFTKQWEGGYVDIPEDKGGATNYGISIRFLEKVDSFVLKQIGISLPITVQTIKDIVPKQAAELMYSEFWVTLDLPKVKSDAVAFAIFDMGVNHGIPNTVRMVQKACNKHSNVNLSVDGILGPKTIAAVNDASDALFIPIVDERLNFYQAIVNRNPTQKKFLKGWNNRAKAMIEYYKVTYADDRIDRKLDNL